MIKLVVEKISYFEKIKEECQALIDDLNFIQQKVRVPCRIVATFPYGFEHRSWNQMQALPTFFENDKFKVVGPKPTSHIYFLKHNYELPSESFELLKKDFNLKQSVIALLSPNFNINWHVDFFPEPRYHIPLITNLDSFVETRTEKVNLVKGSVYLLDTSLEHTAYNLGKTNRIHLIGD